MFRAQGFRTFFFGGGGVGEGNFGTGCSENLRSILPPRSDFCLQDSEHFNIKQEIPWRAFFKE